MANEDEVVIVIDDSDEEEWVPPTKKAPPPQPAQPPPPAAPPAEPPPPLNSQPSTTEPPRPLLPHVPSGQPSTSGPLLPGLAPYSQAPAGPYLPPPAFPPQQAYPQYRPLPLPMPRLLPTPKPAFVPKQAPEHEVVSVYLIAPTLAMTKAGLQAFLPQGVDGAFVERLLLQDMGLLRKDVVAYHIISTYSFYVYVLPQITAVFRARFSEAMPWAKPSLDAAAPVPVFGVQGFHQNKRLPYVPWTERPLEADGPLFCPIFEIVPMSNFAPRPSPPSLPPHPFAAPKPPSGLPGLDIFPPQPPPSSPAPPLNYGLDDLPSFLSLMKKGGARALAVEFIRSPPAAPVAIVHVHPGDANRLLQASMAKRIAPFMSKFRPDLGPAPVPEEHQLVPHNGSIVFKRDLPRDKTPEPAPTQPALTPPPQPQLVNVPPIPAPGPHLALPSHPVYPSPFQAPHNHSGFQDLGNGYFQPPPPPRRQGQLPVPSAPVPGAVPVAGGFFLSEEALAALLNGQRPADLIERLPSVAPSNSRGSGPPQPRHHGEEPSSSARERREERPRYARDRERERDRTAEWARPPRQERRERSRSRAAPDREREERVREKDREKEARDRERDRDRRGSRPPPRVVEVVRDRSKSRGPPQPQPEPQPESQPQPQLEPQPQPQPQPADSFDEPEQGDAGGYESFDD